MSELTMVHSKKTERYAIIGEKEEILAIWEFLKMVNSATEEDE